METHARQTLRLQTRELNDPESDASRLALLGHVPHAELLAAYGEIDIALDPFPYSLERLTLSPIRPRSPGYFQDSLKRGEVPFLTPVLAAQI